jgi:hypothetical protein
MLEVQGEKCAVGSRMRGWEVGGQVWDQGGRLYM